MINLLGLLALPPQLKKRDFWLVILPFVAWVGLIQLRPLLLKTHCASSAAACTAQNVPAIDQPGLGVENSAADGYSYFTQNLSGALAVAVPPLWHAATAAFGVASPSVALASAGTDFVMFLETWGINGAADEAMRLVVQRPRPYVYGDPIRARDPQNYVSFYSGHTSFAAAACVCLLLILISRAAPAPLLLFFGCIAQCLVISTAIYRVLAGRHFVTDVLAGAVMGSLVALMVAYAHRPSRKSA